MADADSPRFDALVTPHLPALYRFAYRLVRNVADAQDLVQDTCIAACENFGALRSADRPDRWLLRVLKNRFLNMAERRVRAPFVPLEVMTAVQMASGEPGPDDLLQQADDEQALERAFLMLDGPQRTLLALRAEGYCLDEIQAVTGIGKEVLHARLYRARCSLARHLEQPKTDAQRVARLPRSAR